jgi:hypothetical protein
MAMDPEKVEHTVSYLTGEVRGLLIVSQVLASAHPDPQKLLSRWDEIEQTGLANIIDTATIDGYRFALASIRTAVEATAAKERTDAEIALGEALGASLLLGMFLKALVHKKLFSDPEVADVIDQALLGMEKLQGTKGAPKKAVARTRTMLEGLLSSFSSSRPTS